MTDENHNSGRRRFVKSCLLTAGAVAANPRLLDAGDAKPRAYEKSLLVDKNGNPMTPKSFETSRHYLFNYPYATTPCFLIDLGRPAEAASTATHAWPGGIGPGSSIVAFSAICTHKLSYPTRTASFINFRADQITFQDSENGERTGTDLIYCCSERSVYDPAQGAQVLGGPAPVPLTTIILEHDPATDHLHAVATLGVEQYERFFEEFGFRIALENKNDDIRRSAGEQTEVYLPDRYSDNRIEC